MTEQWCDKCNGICIDFEEHSQETDSKDYLLQSNSKESRPDIHSPQTEQVPQNRNRLMAADTSSFEQEIERAKASNTDGEDMTLQDALLLGMEKMRAYIEELYNKNWYISKLGNHCFKNRDFEKELARMKELLE